MTTAHDTTYERVVVEHMFLLVQCNHARTIMERNGQKYNVYYLYFNAFHTFRF